MQKRKFKFAPLNGTYMAVSLIGLFVSVMYVYEQSADFGIAFAIVFAIMFVASLLSMTYADPDAFIELETKNRKKK